jgi:16S rRNA (adenine(1408)-N(1))-methyltransferase
MDVGAGDGRFALARAAEHGDELVLAVDASHAAMRQSSWRASRSQRRGGLPNAVFVASSLVQLPAALAGFAQLVTVHFPWGSLLDAAVGGDPVGTERLARLLAPGGVLRLLVSASQRDTAGGATALDPAAVVAAYAVHGFVTDTCRPATLDDVESARSSWGRRLLTSGGDRQAWLIELGRVESADGRAMRRVRA